MIDNEADPIPRDDVRQRQIVGTGIVGDIAGNERVCRTVKSTASSKGQFEHR
jgi:hypothetical protein